MSHVILENVKKDYGRVTAVKNINISIEDQEFLVLVGPSGCGKTTTLRMIAGLEDVTEGRIMIADRDVTYCPARDRDIAMVFQNYALYPHMDVAQNMSFGLKLRKFEPKEIKRRVKKAADILQIHQYLDRKPKELSGGQRQRVAMGRAIVRDPKVFLFDEPLSNLDAKLRVQMRAELALLHQRLSVTTIYVTHDQTEAMTLADRIVLMNQGEIIQEGKPTELYDTPRNKFVAGFIGSPAMSFNQGSLVSRDGEVCIEVGGQLFKVPEERKGCLDGYTESEVWLGSRPEHILVELPRDNQRNFQKFEAEVTLVEPMGHEIIVSASRDGAQFTLRAPAHSPIQTKQSMTFFMDMQKVHFFHINSQESLCS